MRALIFVALLAVTAATASIAVEARAGADVLCAAFGRTCDCPQYVRDCVPTCHIPPRIKCEPAF